MGQNTVQNETELTTAVSNNMEETHRSNAEQKSDTKENVHESIYVKFKNQPN